MLLLRMEYSLIIPYNYAYYSSLLIEDFTNSGDNKALCCSVFFLFTYCMHIFPKLQLLHKFFFFLCFQLFQFPHKSKYLRLSLHILIHNIYSSSTKELLFSIVFYIRSSHHLDMSFMYSRNWIASLELLLKKSPPHMVSTNYFI